MISWKNTTNIYPASNPHHALETNIFFGVQPRNKLMLITQRRLNSLSDILWCVKILHFHIQHLPTSEVGAEKGNKGFIKFGTPKPMAPWRVSDERTLLEEIRVFFLFVLGWGVDINLCSPLVSLHGCCYKSSGIPGRIFFFSSKTWLRRENLRLRHPKVPPVSFKDHHHNRPLLWQLAQ